MKPINLIKNRIASFCILLLACVLQGCVQDDLSDCGVGIKFRYIKNVDGIDKFTSSVERITLFVFDEEGYFIDEYSDEGDILKNNYTMNLPLKGGKYQLVAWGNLCEDYELTGYTRGVTKIDEVLLSLKRQDNVVNEHPTHLFYGGVESIDLQSPYTGRKYITMDMMKNTNTIYVKTKGLPVKSDTKAESAWGTEFTCTITSVNGDYRFDNSITGERLTYIPEYSRQEETLDSGFVIMRELNDGSTGSRLIISYNGEAEKEPEILLDTDLTKLLVPASITGDLDIDDEFTLEVLFDYTSGNVTITINDWVVVGGGSVIG